MTSSIHRVKDAAEEGRGGVCCFCVIAAITGLAGGTGDVTHLQAALLSFELRLRDGGRDGLGESCVVLNVHHLEDDCRFWINAKGLFFFFCGRSLSSAGNVKALPAGAKRQREM